MEYHVSGSSCQKMTFTSCGMVSNCLISSLTVTWFTSNQDFSNPAEAGHLRRKKKETKGNEEEIELKTKCASVESNHFYAKSDYRPKVLHRRGEQSRTVLGPPGRYHTAWTLSLCDYSIARPCPNVKRYFQKSKKFSVYIIAPGRLNPIIRGSAQTGWHRGARAQSTPPRPLLRTE